MMKLILEKIKKASIHLWQKATGANSSSILTYNPIAINPQPMPPHLHAILDKHAPLLVTEFYDVVLPTAAGAAIEVRELEAMEADDRLRLNTYYSEQSQLGAKMETIYNVVKPSLDLPVELQSAKPKTSRVFELMSNIAVSFMMSLGCIHLLEINLEEVPANKIPLLLFAISMGIGITLAAKQALILSVIESRRNEKDRSFPHRVPFWDRLKFGDMPSLMSIIIPIVEVGISAPGLMDLLRNDDFLSRAMTYIGAALPAVVNVFLAWGQAYEQIRHTAAKHDWVEGYREQMDLYREETKALQNNAMYVKDRERFEDLTTKIENLEQDFDKQIALVERLNSLAREVYEKWQQSVKIWCRQNKYLMRGD
jgi:hypothetical protein